MCGLNLEFNNTFSYLFTSVVTLATAKPFAVPIAVRPRVTTVTAVPVAIFSICRSFAFTVVSLGPQIGGAHVAFLN